VKFSSFWEQYKVVGHKCLCIRYSCIINSEILSKSGIVVRERSYANAVEWYETVVNTTSEDDAGEFDAAMDDPVYQLQAAMAQLYLAGGYGLEKDPSYAGISVCQLRFAMR